MGIKDKIKGKSRKIRKLENKINKRIRKIIWAMCNRKRLSINDEITIRNSSVFEKHTSRKAVLEDILTNFNKVKKEISSKDSKKRQVLDQIFIDLVGRDFKSWKNTCHTKEFEIANVSIRVREIKSRVDISIIKDEEQIKLKNPAQDEFKEYKDKVGITLKEFNKKLNKIVSDRKQLLKKLKERAAFWLSVESL